MLNFYVECRRNFSNLDRVVEELVVLTCALANKTLAVMRGKHNKRTSGFVKGCVAFLHITIPSLSSPLKRLQLYTLAGEVALVNQLLPQADALYRVAITAIPEVSAVESFVFIFIYLSGYVVHFGQRFPLTLHYRPLS